MTRPDADTGFTDLEPGDRVYLEFVSYFNRSVEQGLVGTVEKARSPEVVLDTAAGTLVVHWDGGVSRMKGQAERADGRDTPTEYGDEWDLWLLHPVDPANDPDGVEP